VTESKWKRGRTISRTQATNWKVLRLREAIEAAAAAASAPVPVPGSFASARKLCVAVQTSVSASDCPRGGSGSISRCGGFTPLPSIDGGSGVSSTAAVSAFSACSI
jgi:hypothetical protein